MRFSDKGGWLGKILGTSLVAAMLAGCGGASLSDSASSATNNGNPSNGASATTQAIVALSAAYYTAAPAANVQITIRRSGPTRGAATVGYATVNGTATAGADYVATNGKVVWNDGDGAPKVVTVPVMGAAGGKNFSLSLVSVEGDAEFGSPAAATIEVGSNTKSSTSSSSGGGSSSSSSSGGSPPAVTANSSGGSSSSSSSGGSPPAVTANSSGGSSSSSSGVTSSSSSSSGGVSSSSSGAGPVSKNVTLTWVAPTLNTDGSALTNLAGYNIYYGTSANTLTQKVNISTIGLLDYVISSLGHGTWYFAITSVNSAGIESDPSATVSTTI